MGKRENQKTFNRHKKAMKTFRLALALMLCTGFICATSSCVVVGKKDNGMHRGWYKIPNHPNHQNQYKKDRPAKSKGKSKEVIGLSLKNVFYHETIWSPEQEDSSTC
jgi:hypothetical protein